MPKISVPHGITASQATQYIRRMRALDLLVSDSSGRLDNSELASQLSKEGFTHVADSTITRDLDWLSALPPIRRHHGAVSIDATRQSTTIAMQSLEARAAKAAMGGAVAKRLLVPGDRVFLGSGSTVRAVAGHMAILGGTWFVTTNNLEVIDAFWAERARCEVALTGGRILPDAGALVGTDCIRSIMDAGFGKAVVTASGLVISGDGDVLLQCHHDDTVPVYQAAIQQAGQALVFVCDSRKLGRTGGGRTYARLSELHVRRRKGTKARPVVLVTETRRGRRPREREVLARWKQLGGDVETVRVP